MGGGIIVNRITTPPLLIDTTVTLTITMAFRSLTRDILTADTTITLVIITEIKVDALKSKIE